MPRSLLVRAAAHCLRALSLVVFVWSGPLSSVPFPQLPGCGNFLSPQNNWRSFRTGRSDHVGPTMPPTGADSLIGKNAIVLSGNNGELGGVAKS